MKMNLQTILTMTVILGVTALVGCQSKESQPALETETEQTEAEPAAQQISGPKTDTVIISQMEFQPADLTVSQGDTVVWINKDLVAHNVTEQPEKEGSVKSDTINNGQSWKMAVDHGFDYICSIHPTMKAKITMK